MTALALAIAAVFCAAAGVVLLRRSGPGWRVGRVLAASPRRSLAEAVDMVERGDGAYVRIEGRVGSDEEFPDEHDNPLVFRRRRLQHGSDGQGWATIGDERDAVPFWLEERGVRVAVDVDALSDGLVVVPRLSQGRASELEAGTLPADVPEGSATLVRLRVEQVSAVDHAWACGVMRPGPDGQPTITGGLGRPLILTTLEPSVAMRVLASGHRRSVVLATVLLVAGALAAAGAVVAGAAGM